MNRRRFLSLLAKGALGATALSQVDLDKLLWEPGKKAIFTPPAEGWMRTANGLLFQRGDIITIEGQFAFDPITRQPTKHLQTFVVTADVAPDVTSTTLPIYPQRNVGPIVGNPALDVPWTPVLVGSTHPVDVTWTDRE